MNDAEAEPRMKTLRHNRWKKQPPSFLLARDSRTTHIGEGSHHQNNILSISLVKLILLIIIIFAIATIQVNAARFEKNNYLLGEKVIIRTTPGAIGFTVQSGDESYKFLGELDSVIAYTPQHLGTYTITETLPDGSAIQTTFNVLLELPAAPQDTGINSIIPTQAPDNTPQNNLLTQLVDNGSSTTSNTRPSLTTTPPVATDIVIPSPHTSNNTNGNQTPSQTSASAVTPSQPGTQEIIGGTTSSTIINGPLVSKRIKAENSIAEQQLADDEVRVKFANPKLLLRTARGTAWLATVNTRSAGARFTGNTGDLGVNTTGDKNTEIEILPKNRHVTSIVLHAADTRNGIDIGFDEPSSSSIDVPLPDRMWTTIYSIDPTNVNFTDGTLTAQATGTELYKCKEWNFTTQQCDGAWQKLMDLTPGQEYQVALSPVDPGFAEATVSTGAPQTSSLSEFHIYGNIPSTLRTVRTPFGVVVTNPTNRTLNISRVVISSSVNLFASVGGVVPTTGWALSAANLVTWTGSIVLGPYNASEFIVNITGSSVNTPNGLITVNATTNISNLSNGGYICHIFNAALQSTAVYFLNSSNKPAYIDRNVTQNNSESYIVNVDNVGGGTAVPVRTTLMIMIPPGWTNVSAALQTGWTIGTVTGDEGSGWLLLPQVATTIAGGAVRNFTFSATAPNDDNVEIYSWYSKLLGPSGNTARALMTSFEPALLVLNSTHLLDLEDERYATTRGPGGSTTIDQYISIPAPFDNVGTNRWSVVVVNPTDNPINVTQIDITSDANVFATPTGITPTVTWALISASNIRWNGTKAVPAHGATEFSTNILADATTITAASISVTTVTTAGTLVDAGFYTGQSSGSIQSASLYAINTSNPGTAILEFAPNRSVNITIRVNNSGASAAVPLNTMMDVHLPPGWINISFPTQTGWTLRQIVNDQTGGSTIRAIVSGTTIANGATRDFSFNATTPIVGGNSTYRIDAMLLGATGQTTTMMISSRAQIAARVIPSVYGINLSRRSDIVSNISKIASLTVVDIAKSGVPTNFNFSIENARTGISTNIVNGTLTAAKENWNTTWSINRTLDPRDFVNQNASSPAYQKISVRWYTSSNNQTALSEDLLIFNTTLDTTAPLVSQLTPPNSLFSANTTQIFIINSSDNIDLRNCTIFINNTANQTNATPVNASNTTFTIQNFADGQYTWNASCIDLVENSNTTENRTFNIDTIIPTAALVAPQNLSKTTMSTMTFTYLPKDANLANCSLYLNGTLNATNTTMVSGIATNFTVVNIADGTHQWTVGCVDKAENSFINQSNRTFYVDTTLPTGSSPRTDPFSPATYDPTATYNFTTTWFDANGIDTVIFEENFTGSLQNHTVVTTDGENYSYAWPALGAGTYAWKMYANDTFGNNQSISLQQYIITPSAGAIDLFLNGTTDNYPVEINESANITAVLQTPSLGYIELYVNEVLVASGSTTLLNITSFNTTGSKNITAIYNATQNYTAASNTLFIVVGDKTGPQTTAVYPQNGSILNVVDITYAYNITEETGIDNCSLYVRKPSDSTSWWNIQWAGRVRFNITEQTDANIDNYSLQIQLNESNFDFSAANTNGTDLRPILINLSGGSQQLIYWIESWNASAMNASIWVKLPLLPASSSQSLYLYYGNPGARSQSNATGTFLRFDDFTTNKIGTYWKTADNDLASGTTFAVANATLNITAGGADVWTANDEYGSVFGNVSGDFIATVSVKSQQNTNVWAKAGIMVRNNMSARTTSTGYSFAAISPGNGYAWQTDTAVVNGFLDTSATAGSPSVYPSNIMLIKANTTFSMRYSKDNGATWPQVGVNTIITSANTTQDVGLSVTSHAGATLSSTLFNQFVVRRYASIPPTVITSPFEEYALNISTTGPFTNPGTNYITSYGYSEGNYSYKFACFDTLHNFGSGNSTEFIIDLTAPQSFSLVSPPNNTITSNQSPTLVWTQSSDLHFKNYTALISQASDFSIENYAYSATPVTNTSVVATVPLGTDTIWYWKVIAYDIAGNLNETAAYRYLVDITPPLITILMPQNNSYQNSTSVNITYTFTDFSNISNCTIMFNDSTSYKNSSLNQTGQNSFISIKTDGTYSFNITCTDIVDNANTTENNIITVDTVVPSPVTLLTPPNNTFSNNKIPLLTWTQSNDDHFANYTIIISDENTFSHRNHTYSAAPVTNASYQVQNPWDDGTWYWKILAYDLAGNFADPFFTYVLDGTPPTAFDLVSPANNTASNDMQPTLSWSQSTDLNFANYTILVSDDAGFAHVNFTYTAIGTANTSIIIPAPWTDNTIWHWKVIALDTANNSINSTNSFVYITDNMNPNVTLKSPSNNSNYRSNTSSLITFTFTVNDLSDIATCTLSVDDAGGTNTYVDYFVTKNINQSIVQSLSNGDYNWSVSCTDAAGNAGMSETYALTVNVTMPGFKLYDSAPYNNPQTDSNSNITATTVYSSTTGNGTNYPKTRDWNGTAWTGERELPTAGSPVRWVKMASSPNLPTAYEKIAVTVSDDGNLDAYVWNGSAWIVKNNIGAIGTTSNVDRSYDVEYETQRGRGMLVYAINSTVAGCDLAYRIWNGSDWEVERCINDPSFATTIRVDYIRIARNPNASSNDLAIAYIDATNSDGRAMIWNGSGWWKPVNITTAISITTKEDIAIAYEQQSYKILAVAGTGSTIAYTSYNGTGWTAPATTDINTVATGTTNFLTLKPNPAGNEIMITGVDGQATPDLSTGLWSAGAWSTPTRHDAGVDTAAARSADFEWEQTGSSGVLVWGTTAGQLAYKTYSIATTWNAQNNIATGTNAHTRVVLKRIPQTSPLDTPILGAAQETGTRVDGIRWTGNIPLLNYTNGITSAQSSTTYQGFDFATESYPQRTSAFLNISLNTTPDGTENIMTYAGAGLTMITNATSNNLGNYSFSGLYLQKGTSVKFSNLFSAMNPGVSFITWQVYAINSSGEYLLCSKGNTTRSTNDTSIGASTKTPYTGSCTIKNDTVITPTQSIRVYTYVNSSVNNTIIKYVDNVSTYVEFDGYLLGNLTISLLSPTNDPLIGEGENMTIICAANCTNGYCLNVQVFQEINDTPTTFATMDYFTGNILLNSSSTNPVVLGSINATLNATFNATGNSYSFNNTIRCRATSDFINATSNALNVSVLDKIPPNIILINPSDGGGYEPGFFTFRINASDRRLGLCTLWGNWSGSWIRNQTVTPNNFTYTDFSPVNISVFGKYKWSVNCSDLANNDALSQTNFTFTIAGDVAIYAAGITFTPQNAVEGGNVTVAALVKNNANRNETEFNVSFYDGDPLTTGTQIGANITIPLLNASGNISVSTSFIARLGKMNIYVLVDPQYGTGVIFEYNETNNLANNTLDVSIWQTYYGNVTGNLSLQQSANDTFSNWFIGNATGNLFIADTDTTKGIQFKSLKAFGRNTTGGTNANTQNDFDELDILLNTTNYTSSINSTYTVSGGPIATKTFTVYGTSIAFTPVINSSSDGNYSTGLLWDSSDSTNSYYDEVNKEDVVFITAIGAAHGVFGDVDYELRVPSPLKKYRGTQDTVTFYYELQ